MAPERRDARKTTIARINRIKPKRFFQILYMILLGTSFGPRLGPYLIDMGRENAIKMLERILNSQK